MKEKVAKQLNKNKELLAKAVVDTPVDKVEGNSKMVLDAMNFSPVVGMYWGGEDKKLLDLFSVFDGARSGWPKLLEPFVDGSTPKVKGMREL